MTPIKHLLIDGSYLAWRSFLATPPLQSRSGKPTNAIHGFLGAVSSAIAGLGKPACHIAWDGGSSGRLKLVDTYKQNRREWPVELVCQLDDINQICQCLGWQTARLPGFEADDVIHTWVRTLGSAPKALFTTDKDLISLVDENTYIYERQKGKIRLLDRQHYTQKWGIPPQRIPDFLALHGDKVDGIPGIKGLGEKTITRLLQEYGTLDEVLAAAHSGKLTHRIQELVLNNQAQISINRKTVQLLSVPVKLDCPSPQMRKAAELLWSLDMVKSAEKLTGHHQPISGVAAGSPCV